MKPEDQKIIDILTQIAEGKEWEFYSSSGGGWFTPHTQDLTHAASLIGHHIEIRLKPEPKMRPLRVEELNPAEVFRAKGDSTLQVGRRSNFSQSWLNTSASKYERTIDGGKTWQTFEVECKEGE